MCFSIQDLRKLATDITSELNDIVFNNIYNYLRDNPEKGKYVNPAFPYPQKIRIGVINNYFIVEYIGPNNENEDTFKTELLYEPEKDLYEFLKIDIKHLNAPRIPFEESIHNLNHAYPVSAESSHSTGTRGHRPEHGQGT